MIGGIGLLRWGEPRFTREVDVTLLTGFGHEEDFIEPILASGYGGRVPALMEYEPSSNATISAQSSQR